MAFPLRTDINSSYPDASAADGEHQVMHDDLHEMANSVVGAYNTAVVGGFEGSIEDWLDQVGAAVTKADVGLGNVDNTSDANKPVSTAQQTALDAKVALTQSVNPQTGTGYTLVAADAGKLVTLSDAGAITLTVPQDSAETIPVGTYIDLYQLGAGQVTVVAGTGATLRTSGLTAKARAQYARFAVQKVSADTWSLFGDLAAS